MVWKVNRQAGDCSPYFLARRRALNDLNNSSTDVKTGDDIMATFEINGKEYDLKITFAAVKRLNSAFEGGSYELIGRAIQGDFEAFPIIIHAALFHTGENFTLKDVEGAIEELFEKQAITFDDIQKISNAVVTESFFFKPTVDKLMKANPEMKKAYEQLMA